MSGHQVQPQSRHEQAGTFPAARLREDVRRCAPSITIAAARAEITYRTVWTWIHRKKVPRVRALTRFLDANGIDRTPYEPFLTPPIVEIVCPRCGRRRSLARSMLKQAERRADRAFRRRPDGSYERWCSRCSHAAAGRANLRKWNDRLVEKVLGLEGQGILEAAREGDPDAQKIRSRVIAQQGQCHLVRAGSRRPRSDAHRNALARAKLLAHPPTKDFYLCPLCELVTYQSRWHHVCYQAWRRSAKWSRVHARTLPTPTRQRGPSPGRKLKRNYWFVIAHRIGGVTRATLRAKAGVATKTGVNDGIDAFLRLLPGSWDLVFSAICRRHANQIRNTGVPLPETLAPFVTRGARDALIRRLGSCGMAEPMIALVAGADVYKVRGVLASAPSIENASS